jgi:hypothetical protein
MPLRPTQPLDSEIVMESSFSLEAPRSSVTRTVKVDVPADSQPKIQDGGAEGGLAQRHDDLMSRAKSRRRSAFVLGPSFRNSSKLSPGGGLRHRACRTS